MVLFSYCKSNVFSTFHDFQVLVERQFSCKTKFIQTDWGGEYSKLNSFFQTIGIHHKLIFPHTHEQNGTIECRHWYIIKSGLTLLGQCSVPLQFWNYVFESSVYIINRMSTLVLQNQYSFECLFHRTLNYNFLSTFRCLCFPFLLLYYAHKLNFHSSPCVFLGYNSSHLGYHCLNLTSQRVYVSFHVRFYKNMFLFAKSKQIAQYPNTSSHPI